MGGDHASPLFYTFSSRFLSLGLHLGLQFRVTLFNSLGLHLGLHFAVLGVEYNYPKRQ